MEEDYNQLVDHLLQKASSLKEGEKYIIGIAGSPGAGKTTTSKQLCQLLNEKVKGIAVVIPMDGFHYYKKQLDKMDDPKEAYARRGAPFTFWAEGLYQLLLKIKSEGEAKAPSFDHRVGDPIEEDIPILKSHKLVIVEGNYLLLDEKPWNEISKLFDEKWYLQIDLDVAMERVRLRHIAELKLSPEKALERIATNDRINAELIDKRRVQPDRIIHIKPNDHKH